VPPALVSVCPTKILAAPSASTKTSHSSRAANATIQFTAATYAPPRCRPRPHHSPQPATEPLPAPWASREVCLAAMPSPNDLQAQTSGFNLPLTPASPSLQRKARLRGGTRSRTRRPWRCADKCEGLTPGMTVTSCISASAMPLCRHRRPIWEYSWRRSQDLTRHRVMQRQFWGCVLFSDWLQNWFPVCFQTGSDTTSATTPDTSSTATRQARWSNSSQEPQPLDDVARSPKGRSSDSPGAEPGLTKGCVDLITRGPEVRLDEQTAAIESVEFQGDRTSKDRLSLDFFALQPRVPGIAPGCRG
jgi:hypothetical protein